jgi:TolB-like protein
MKLSLFVLSLVLLSACNGHYSHYENDPYYNGRTSTQEMQKNWWWNGNESYTDNELAYETYRAVDRILHQANMAPGNNTPLIVGTIANINQMEKAHSFGRVVSEQASTRLVQKGHDVSELKLRNSVNIKQGHVDLAEGGEYMMSRDIESIRGEYKIGRVVTGTYGIAGKEIMVNLKMVDIATGKILGSTDYAVVIDSNIQKLIQDNAFSFYGSSMAY